MTFICAGFKRVRQRLGTLYGNGTLDAQATGVNAYGTITVTLPASPSTNQTITINNTGTGTVTVSGTITGGYTSAEMSADASFTISWNESSWDVDSESGTIVYIVSVVYATWNPDDCSSQIVLSNGDLTAAGISNYGIVRSTIGKAIGKWYWEMTRNIAGSDMCDIGIIIAGTSLSSQHLGVSGYSYAAAGTEVVFNGKKVHISFASYDEPNAVDVGGIVGVALDMDSGTIRFYRNGVDLGIAFSGISGTLYAGCSTGEDTWTVNFGASAFTYTPPVGYNSGLYT